MVEKSYGMGQIQKEWDNPIEQMLDELHKEYGLMDDGAAEGAIDARTLHLPEAGPPRAAVGGP